MIEWIKYIFKWLWCRLFQCQMVAGYAIRQKFLRRSDMATTRWKLLNTPSPSDFIEKMEYEYRADGGAIQTVIPFDLPANTIEIEADFPLNAVIEWWCVWFSDNGKHVESNHVTFTATNEEVPVAGQALGQQFVRYNP